MLWEAATPAIAMRLRAAQVDAVSQALERHGVDPHEFPASVIVVLMNGVARIMVMEQALGHTDGHDDETLAFVERYLTRLEGEAKPIPAEWLRSPPRPGAET